MKIIFLFIAFFSINVAAMDNCADIFLDITAAHEYKLNLKNSVNQFEDYESFNSLRKWTSAIEVIKKISGNTLESSVRVRRIQMGQRFFRLLRAGDIVRAVNYVRPLMQTVRTSAELLVWAQGSLLKLEEMESTVELSASEKKQAQELKLRFKEVIDRESESFSRFGDFMMIIDRLKTYHKSLSTEINARKLADNLSQADEDAMQLLQKSINDDVLRISKKMTGMNTWAPVFNDLFKADLASFSSRKYSTELDARLNAEADFVDAVLHNQIFRDKKVYGAELPLRAVVEHEFAWETLAAFKNLASVITKRYSDLMRVIDRANTQSIADRLVGVKNDKKAYLGYRKLLRLILSDLSIIAAIEKHTQQIYVVEDFMTRFKQKKESRSHLVAALGSAAADSNNDFLNSFARIRDFQPLFREVMEQVRLESAEKKATYKELSNGNWSEEILYKKMQEAQKLVESGALSEISLSAEPDYVHMVMKQTLAFGGGVALPVFTLMYYFSPDKWANIKDLLSILSGLSN